MRVYNLENSLNDDKCAMVNREFVNKSVNDYSLYNNFFTSQCDTETNEKMNEFMFDNPNLRFRDGYGFLNSCTVDLDSALRNDSRLTHDKTKVQLCTRWNKAVPGLDKGGLIPNLESRLRDSEDTSVIKNCSRISEMDYNRYTPLVGCIAPTIQNDNHIILPFTRGGDITRNYIFSNSYLEKCGFKNNGQFYEKVNNSAGPVGQKQFSPVFQQQQQPDKLLARPVSTQ
jgi:hypothetical protein